LRNTRTQRWRAKLRLARCDSSRLSGRLNICHVSEFQRRIHALVRLVAREKCLTCTPGRLSRSAGHFLTGFPRYSSPGKGSRNQLVQQARLDRQRSGLRAVSTRCFRRSNRRCTRERYCKRRRYRLVPTARGRAGNMSCSWRGMNRRMARWFGKPPLARDRKAEGIQRSREQPEVTWQSTVMAHA
jgi:hypothetical protein